jgi:DUF1680 family protein
MQHKHRSLIVNTSYNSSTVLHPVPVSAVKLTDRFWKSRLHIIHHSAIKQQYQKLVETGRIDNFSRVNDASEKPFTEPVFNDSDVYKWLEAAAWALASESDDELLLLVNKVIDLVIKAQHPDGYLNTYYALESKRERWTNIRDMHELYCAGHFFQAAVALKRCIGESRLLESAVRFADYLVSKFMSSENDPIEPPGHPEVEMALVELTRETGDRRYLRLAQSFLNARGKGRIGGSEYHLDHRPFLDLERLTGHAVRALYLCAGAADIAIETGDEQIIQTLKRLWKHMTTHLMYITGGVGSCHQGEAIGADFELPNAQAYAETCAAIATVMWAWRMLHLAAECQFADYIEHIMYNAVLPGVSIDGASYFYINPLTDDGTHRRKPWFHCACCPPNIARTIAKFPGLIYSVAEDAIWIHQYTANEATLMLPNGNSVSIHQRTRYPWDGNVIVEVLDNRLFSLNLRIPLWCGKNVEININGDLYPGIIHPGSYVSITRSWSIGDSVCIQFPMPLRIMKAHPHIRENTGKASLMRGPLLYCFEAIDNPHINLPDAALDPYQKASSIFQPDLLNGVQILEVPALEIPPGEAWNKALYREKQSITPPETKQTSLIAIPYFAWGNREPGQMMIWLSDTIESAS